jgi:hypothetical protein
MKVLQLPKQRTWIHRPVSYEVPRIEFSSEEILHLELLGASGEGIQVAAVLFTTEGLD